MVMTAATSVMTTRTSVVVMMTAGTRNVRRRNYLMVSMRTPVSWNIHDICTTSITCRYVVTVMTGCSIDYGLRMRMGMRTG